MKKVLILPAVLVAALFTAPVAGAATTQCSGVLPPGTYDKVEVPKGASCVFSDAVTVKGDVEAKEDSRLHVHERSRIGGHLHGHKADVVQVINSIVEGDVNIHEGGPGPAADTEVALCNSTVVKGNVKVEKMNGQILIGGPDQDGSQTARTSFSGDVPPNNTHGCDPTNNVVKGDVEVKENTITPQPGLLVDFGIYSNTIGGNLKVEKNVSLLGALKEVQYNKVAKTITCKENGAPFVGSPNTANKFEGGQCGP